MVHKNIKNIVYQHYVEKPHIIGLPIGRPNKRIASFTYNSKTTFFDRLRRKFGLLSLSLAFSNNFFFYFLSFYLF